MQVPYWTALTVHLTSSLVYPVFPWVRSFFAPGSVPSAQFGRIWLMTLGALVAVFTIVYGLGNSGHEPTWPFLRNEGRQSDRDFCGS